jgi:2-polyprenyl-6-methoxyphenol hydroxylase-like FAD-dependent oxidoreductase
MGGVMKIIIVGAGIAGITTSISLIQKGFSVQLFEKVQHDRSTGAGIVLGNNALRVLDQLGIYKKIVGNSIIPSRNNVLSWKGERLAAIKPLEKNENTHSFACLSRSKLYEILKSSLPYNLITFGKKLTDVTPRGEDVQITFDDGSRLTCDLLLACDGIHSSIRNALFSGSKIRYAGYTCWRGITSPIPGIQEKAFTETWGSNGRFGIAPIEDDRYYWYALKNTSADNESYMKWTKADLMTNFEQYHSPIRELILSTNTEAIMKHDIFDVKPLKHYTLGRVALVGDAAHATTPNLGQGACQAIEDAYVIAETLSNYQDVEQALKVYQKLRKKPATKIVNLSWKIGKIAQLESPHLCSLRDIILKLQNKLQEKK